MIGNKIAHCCTLVPEVIYFHCTRSSSSPIAVKAVSQSMIFFLSYKVCVTGNNERHIREVSYSYNILIFVSILSGLGKLARKVLFKHKILVLYLYLHGL